MKEILGNASSNAVHSIRSGTRTWIDRMRALGTGHGSGSTGVTTIEQQLHYIVRKNIAMTQVYKDFNREFRELMRIDFIEVKRL